MFYEYPVAPRLVLVPQGTNKRIESSFRRVPSHSVLYILVQVSTSYASASSLELEEVKCRLSQAEEESLRLRQEAEKAQGKDV